MKKSNKLGALYKGIAHHYLKQSRPDISFQARIDLLNQDLDTVEAELKLVPFIEAGINAICSEIKKYGVTIPSADLETIILTSQTPTKDLHKYAVEIKSLGILNEYRAALAVATTSKVYRKMVKAGLLTLEPDFKLAGITEVDKAYIFVEDILYVLHLHVDHAAFSAAYDALLIPF